MPILSVCTHSPLLASQILIIPSYNVDASRVESCEKATELLWPSRVCKQALHFISYNLVTKA